MVSIRLLSIVALTLVTISATPLPIDDGEYDPSWDNPVSRGDDKDPSKPHFNRVYSGHMWWTTFDGTTACNKTLNADNIEGKYYVGVSGQLWNDGKNCGKTIRAWFVNGKNHTAEIVDTCAKCDITASPTMFEVGNVLEKAIESAWWQLQD